MLQEIRFWLVGPDSHSHRQKFEFKLHNPLSDFAGYLMVLLRELHPLFDQLKYRSSCMKFVPHGTDDFGDDDWIG